MATEHIYTVSSHDDCDAGYDHCVIGSYRTMERAVAECADYILGRLDCRDDLAWCMARDGNHGDAARYFGDDADGWKVVKDEAGLRKYIRDELTLHDCYHASDGFDAFHFDIDENDLED